MMGQQQSRVGVKNYGVNKRSTTNKVYNASGNKSDRGSVKSGGSVNSRNSKTKGVNYKNKNPSVYDSDTESSRMRRANNGRASPYRQSSRPSTSANKKQNQPRNTKYSNISNLYTNPNTRNNRSRSRSQDSKRSNQNRNNNTKKEELATVKVSRNNMHSPPSSNYM